MEDVRAFFTGGGRHDRGGVFALSVPESDPIESPSPSRVMVAGRTGTEERRLNNRGFGGREGDSCIPLPRWPPFHIPSLHFCAYATLAW